MKWFSNLSLGVKINLVIFIAISTLLGIIVVRIRTGADTLVYDVGQQKINQESIVVNLQLRQAQAELQSSATLLANTPGFVEAVANNQENAIQSLYLSAVASLNINDFDVVDIDGNVLFTIDDDDDDRAEEVELLNQALLGIQRTTLSVEDGNIRIASVRFIRDDNGTIVGGMLLGRPIDDAFLDTIRLDRQDVQLSVIFDDQIVATSSETDLSENYASGLETDLLAQALLSGVTISNPETINLEDGLQYTEAYLPLQGLDDRSPRAVIAIRAVNELAIYRNNLINSSVFALVALIASIIITTFTIIYYTVTKPVKQLQSATSNFAKGNYNERALVQGQDELGQLAVSFNQMASDIQSRDESLNTLNQSLEQRVKERTVELEAARKEAQASARIANENSRLKSEFLSMMSHELRTPMNAIEGFTGIILQGMAGVEYNDKTERFVSKIQSNSRRLLALINDILDLSRIESGRLELAHQPFSPYELAQQWENNLSVLADEKNLEFEVNIDSQLPQTIYGDEETLSKVAINLLGNAIKFTEEGKVSLSFMKQGNDMILTVKDTGIGIPPHAREFVFEEFRQVDQTSKRKYGGTGLGLAITQKLVRAMSGIITLDSEVGVGSTFKVVLPIHTEPML
ncbi:MAG: hypothetical protein Phog2KO_44980 [Phototrophicaceae bacterium]